MSYNGSGTFNINSTGQPVVAGTVITASAFNALTTDLATGLTTAITKDGQTTTTAQIPFAQGLRSTLVTDSSSVSTGSIITDGGVGIAKNLYVGGTLNVTGSTSLTNPVINNIKMGYSTTATAGGSTSLTVSSNYRQFFTGTLAQTIVLPVTSTLVTGMAYEIENNSTGLLTVNSSGGNLVGTIPAGVCAHAVCIGTTLTTAADWDWDYISTTTITGTGANVLGTSPTITTPTISSLSSAAATALTLQSAGSTAITVDTSQNATFAKSIILSGSTSGTTTLASTAVAGTSTATFPAATGTVMVSGNMPAFSAYASSGTSCASSTSTKILFQVENFDTNNCFTSSTFTPTVAGYYQINAAVAIITTLGFCYVSIYKNNVQFNTGNQVPNNSVGIQVSVSSLVYMNGTTDYLEIFLYQSSGSAVNSYTANNNNYSYFNGALVRAA